MLPEDHYRFHVHEIGAIFVTVAVLGSIIGAFVGVISWAMAIRRQMRAREFENRAERSEAGQPDALHILPWVP